MKRVRTSGLAGGPTCQGAFYLFPDLGSRREALTGRGIADSPVLCQRLLEETGVALLPGSVFGRPREELTVRLSFVDFDGAAALQAAAQLPRRGLPDAGFLGQYCPRTLQAIDRLVDWLG